MDPNFIYSCNRLTQRWVEKLDPKGNSVCSGPGAWVLLFALLKGANDELRADLNEAILYECDESSLSLTRILETLAKNESISFGSGIWTKPEVQIFSEYLEFVSPMEATKLPSDLSELDQWIREQTSGRITTFPKDFSEDTELLMASVTAASAKWVHPFTEGEECWNEKGELQPWLYAQTSDKDAVSIIENGDTAISRLIWPTIGTFDVHLLSGSSDDSPAAVLSSGITALFETEIVKQGSTLNTQDGVGCLELKSTQMPVGLPTVRVSLPAFDVSNKHDLTLHAGMFGIQSALDTSKGHFPKMSDHPLAVEKMSQQATASFSAEGFEATAVTTLAVSAGMGAFGDVCKTLVYEFCIDKPFGFLVVDRSSNLVIFAGWVHDPKSDAAEM